MFPVLFSCVFADALKPTFMHFISHTVALLVIRYLGASEGLLENYPVQ
jgi:hypothetical protein